MKANVEDGCALSKDSIRRGLEVGKGPFHWPPHLTRFGVKLVAIGNNGSMKTVGGRRGQYEMIFPHAEV